VSEQTLDLISGTRFVTKNVEGFRTFPQGTRNAVHRFDVVAQIGELFHHLLRRSGVVPKPIGVRARLEFGYCSRFAGMVKDAP
jgi:hypothetical protein